MTRNDNNTKGNQMTTARQHVANANRASRISRLAKGLCYEIDFASCPGFWFVRIDGRSYIIGHDGTDDAEMARKALAWAKQCAA
jgi:hypothetical protein